MEGVVAPPSPLLGLGSQVAGLALHSPAPLPAGLPADGPGATGFFHGQTSHRNPPQGGREGSDSCESSASASGPLSPAAGYAPSVSMPVGAAAAVIASAASKLGAPAGFAAPQPQASQGSPQNGNARDHIFSNFAPQAAKAMAPNTAAVIAQADVGPNLQQRVFSTPVQMQALKKNQNEMVGNWILGKVCCNGIPLISI